MLEWFVTQPAGLYEWATVLALPVLLTLFVVRALWVILMPGEIESRERRRLFKVNRGSLLDQRWFFQVLIPVVLIVGYVLLFFPVARPLTIALSSRSRSLNQRMGIWQDQWSVLVSKPKLNSSRRILDAGPIVDYVLQGLAGGREGNGSLADPQYLALIRGRIEKALAETTPVYHRSLRSVPLGDAPTKVERWVIETVELSVLQSLLARYNVRAVAFLGADRQTPFGNCWGRLPAFINRGNHTVLVPNILRAAEGVRLISADFPRQEPDGQKVVSCLMEIEGLAEKTTATFVLTDARHAPSRSIRTEFDLAAHGGVADGLQVYLIPMTTFPPDFVPNQAQVEYGSQPGTPVRLFTGNVGKEETEIVLKGLNSQSWNDTWKALTSGIARYEELSETREKLQRILDIAHVKFVSAPNTDLAMAVDATISPNAIWVYPAKWTRATEVLSQRVKRSAGETTSPRQSPWLAVPGEGSTSGEYSFGGLAIPGGPTVSPTSVPGLVVVDGRRLSSNIYDGMQQIASSPIVWREELPVDIGRTPSRRVVTMFAISSENPHLTIRRLDELDSPSLESQFLYAFWIELMRSVRAGAAEAVLRDEPKDADHPMVVWTDDDLAFARSDSLRGQLTPFLLAIATYATYVWASVRRAPNQQKGLPLP